MCLLRGERANPAFLPWLEAQTEIATADVVRGEFLLGVYAVQDNAKRRLGEQFYSSRFSPHAWGWSTLPLSLLLRLQLRSLEACAEADLARTGSSPAPRKLWQRIKRRIGCAKIARGPQSKLPTLPLSLRRLLIQARRRCPVWALLQCLQVIRFLSWCHGIQARSNRSSTN